MQLFIHLKYGMKDRRQFIKVAGTALLGAQVLGGSALAETTGIFTQEILKPQALKSGDTIAISSPAGAVWDDAQMEKFTGIIEGLGFKVKTGQTLKEKFGYFAGTDEMRAKEINTFFADEDIRAVFCMKGGWGCARLLDKIDYDLIRKNPKIIMGFSDITSLLIALYSKTGLVTFHGPVGNSGWNDFSVDYIQRILMKKEAVSYAYPEKDDDRPYTINPGKAKGVLIGGNLTVLAGIMGSDYLPPWKNKILFLEEAKEEPYEVDRMLTQLKLAGVLQNISGFVFGKCAKCEAEEPAKAFTLKEVLEQHIKPLGIPAFYGAMIGHIENKYTVPIGIEAEMDAGKCTMKLLESAVL
ncbi:MAG TPA: LD-carboxypeptidase [Bacteroidia bacterium]|jgi:muramoyltetrapeptide carboxypeptidase|nr:LD-carboxypeptidase [Bacteroidia bacterium]